MSYQGDGLPERLRALVGGGDDWQKRLAEAVGVYPANVEKWRIGMQRPSWTTLCVLLYAFPAADARWLITGETQQAAEARFKAAKAKGMGAGAGKTQTGA